jgi:hypothetical protein
MSSGAMRFSHGLTAGLLLALMAPADLQAQSQVPVGSRFLVELRTKLEAKKVKRGKKFEARTLEAIQAADGRLIPAGRKLKGQVSYVEGNRMVLRFEEIDTGRGRRPIIATVTQVVGERNLRTDSGREGEIRAGSNRGRNAAIGAAIVGGAGAAIGATQGGREAAIGGASGAAAGAAIGAAHGGANLVLDKGTRLELHLDRPLSLA